MTLFAKLGRSYLLLILLVFVWGCSERTDRDDNLFGDPYRIETTESSAGIERLPILSGDTLNVRVSYSGGCKDHDFDFEDRSGKDSTILYFVHDARGDTCKEFLWDSLQVRLKGNQMERPFIVLLDPEEPHSGITLKRPPVTGNSRFRY